MIKGSTVATIVVTDHSTVAITEDIGHSMVDTEDTASVDTAWEARADITELESNLLKEPKHLLKSLQNPNRSIEAIYYLSIT